MAWSKTAFQSLYQQHWWNHFFGKQIRTVNEQHPAWEDHCQNHPMHITFCGSPWLPADICQYFKKQTSSDTCWKSYDYTAYSQHNTTKHIVKELSQRFTTEAQNFAQVQTTQLSVTVIFLCSDVFEATL